MTSPYSGIPVEKWQEKTKELIESHPLTTDEAVSTTLEAWDKILQTKIGGELQIGDEIKPSPQIMGNYLHELIPAILAKKHPQSWRRESSKDEKDLVYIPDPELSVEIKTSSQNKIYGNRSYGQEQEGGKKKYGYYLAVNFEKFPEEGLPKIKKIKFGWLDHSDWKAQAAATGQNSTLDKNAWEKKLLELHPNSEI